MKTKNNKLLINIYKMSKIVIISMLIFLVITVYSLEALYLTGKMSINTIPNLYYIDGNLYNIILTIVLGYITILIIALNVNEISWNRLCKKKFIINL